MNNKVKTIITVAIIIMAGSLAVVFTATDFTNAKATRQTCGIIIDHGDYDVKWLPDNDLDRTVRSSLNLHQSRGDIEITWENNEIVSIDGIENDDEHKWDLWVVKRGDNGYQRFSGQYDAYLSDYTAVTVAYTDADSKPVPATDYLGNAIFGMTGIGRTVTLSPSVTEIICSLDATNTIVGSDSASDYPKEFIDRKSRGDIEIVADFLNVSMEKIISVNPDVVLFDGSATHTIEVARHIEATTSIKTCVLYPDVTSKAIMDNIMIAGTVLGDEYRTVTFDLLTKLITSYDELKNITSVVKEKRSGVVIMSDSFSPKDWGAGKDTCVRDYIVTLNGNYAFDDLYIYTWSEFNFELLLEKDPDFIIVISSSYKGHQGYDDMINNHHDTWQKLKAWENKRILLLYDSAYDITSRLGPRFVNCSEIFAKYMYPELFEKKIDINYLGDNYVDYLSISEEVFA